MIACVRLLGVVGQCGPAAPLPRLLACVLTPLVWACWRVRGAACPMGGGRPGRGGTWLSRPMQRGAAPVALRVDEKEGGGARPEW